MPPKRIPSERPPKRVRSAFDGLGADRRQAWPVDETIPRGSRARTAPQPPRDDRRLDSLARLLEPPSECAAVSIYGGRLLAASNGISSTTSTSQLLRSTQATLSYFRALARQASSGIASRSSPPTAADALVRSAGPARAAPAVSTGFAVPYTPAATSVVRTSATPDIPTVSPPVLAMPIASAYGPAPIFSSRAVPRGTAASFATPMRGASVQAARASSVAASRVTATDLKLLESQTLQDICFQAHQALRFTPKVLKPEEVKKFIKDILCASDNRLRTVTKIEEEISKWPALRLTRTYGRAGCLELNLLQGCISQLAADFVKVKTMAQDQSSALSQALLRDEPSILQEGAAGMHAEMRVVDRVLRTTEQLRGASSSSRLAPIPSRYVGLSKLCCIKCYAAIRAVNRVCGTSRVKIEPVVAEDAARALTEAERAEDSLRRPESGMDRDGDSAPSGPGTSSHDATSHSDPDVRPVEMCFRTRGTHGLPFNWPIHPFLLRESEIGALSEEDRARLLPQETREALRNAYEEELSKLGVAARGDRTQMEATPSSSAPVTGSAIPEEAAVVAGNTIALSDMDVEIILAELRNRGVRTDTIGSVQRDIANSLAQDGAGHTGVGAASLPASGPVGRSSGRVDAAPSSAPVRSQPDSVRTLASSVRVFRPLPGPPPITPMAIPTGIRRPGAGPSLFRQ